MTALQLDLFGQVEKDESRRYRRALTCLAEAHPHALEILIGVREPDRGEIKQGLTGRWAYSRRQDGFYFELAREWESRGGWHTKPAHRITWPELDALLDSDPRINDIRRWSESLTSRDAWRDRYRPFELHPNAAGWHPSYLAADHARPRWPDRHEAWNLTITTYRTALKQLS